MADIAKLRILVDMDSSGVVRGAAASTAAIAGFERTTTQALTRVTSGFQNLSTGQKGLLGIGTTAVLVGTALSAAVGPAIEFESAFAGVEKTVEGTPSQLAEIRQGILDLSATIPTAAEDLADIAANAGQLGVAAPKVLEFTKTVAGLGETTDLSFDAAAQSLARFLNVTGNDADVERLGDVIVELGNNSATTESQILTFGQRLSTSFTLAGAAEQEILALGASLSSLGIEAESGASALNTAIARITDASKLGGRELQILADASGVTAEEFQNLARESPVEALLLFSEGLAGLNEEGRSTTPTLEALGLNGLRVRRALEALGLGADLTRDSLRLANEQIENGGALAEEAGKRYETTASRIAILQNRVRRLFITLGTPALDGFARGADLAGDVIEELIEILGPLGGQILETFGNLGEAAAFLFDIFGQPVLQVLGAALLGAATSAAALLEVLNAFGPVGAVLAGVLVAVVAFPGALATAVSAGAALTTTLGAVGVSGTAAAAGIKAVQVAASAGPFLVVAAALAILGKGLLDAGEAAREAGDQYRTGFAEAVNDSDFGSARATIQDLVDRQRELEEQTGRSGGKWSEFVAGFKSGLGGGGNLQAAVDFQALNAELDELDAILDELDFGNLQRSLVLTTEALGLSENQVLTLAQDLDILDLATDGSTESMLEFKRRIEEATVEERRLADETGILADKILSGKATIEDYADALGITSSELARLAERIDGVDLKDFEEGGEAAVRAFDAVEDLLAGYAALADQVGLTSDEYRAQINAVDDLAASHSDLRQAIDGAASALELIEAQQQRTNEATVAFDEALQSISETDGLEAAARALRTLSLEYAGSGVSAAEATAKQEELYRSFLLAAEGAGIAESEAIAVAIALGLVPEAVLAQITVEGQEAKDEASEVERQLKATEREYRATMTANAEQLADTVADSSSSLAAFIDQDYIAFLQGNGVPLDEAVAAAEARAQEFVDTEFMAILEANGMDAEEVIAQAKKAAELYRDTEYMAFLEANGLNAEEVIGFTKEQADALAAGDYTAFLKAVDAGATSEIRRVQGVAQGFADGFERAEAQRFARIGGRARAAGGGYTATLRANDQASRTIEGVNEELNRFRSKTITLRANYIGPNNLGSITVPRTSYSSTSSGSTSTTSTRSGSTFRAFDDGGISGLLTAGVRATPGVADIFAPMTPFRVFAEPSTGGETYIPHNGDRARNRNIWETHGRMAGFMEHGGIAQFLQNGSILAASPSGSSSGGNSFLISAPITVDLSNLPTGASISEVATEMQRQISDAFEDLSSAILQGQ